MASGWAADDAVQKQIDATIESELVRLRAHVRTGRSHCQECGEEIPARRRLALPSARFCLECQAAEDSAAVHRGYNRRGSKDSQLK
jgi:phage/conjugal plasmid C-4 type zinc finger TraR family protein